MFISENLNLLYFNSCVIEKETNLTSLMYLSYSECRDRKNLNDLERVFPKRMYSVLELNRE